MVYTGYTDIAQFFDRVRASLKLDASSLSDTAIGYPEYAPLAERQIKKRVTGWATLTAEDDITDFETAIVIQTAINCYHSFVNGSVKSKQTPNIKVEYDAKKEKDKTLLDELIDRLNEIIIILTDADDTDIFFGFVVT
jgi:hypothetical protein